MAGTVNGNQVSTFTSPQNGDTLDATVVAGNDNATRAAHNTHDADASIHVQSSSLASRPVAGTAQRVWITTDGKRAYLDDGSSWSELQYLPLAAGGTVAGNITVSSGGVTVTGNSTITGTLGGLTGLTVASGGAAVTGNSTVTGTLTTSGALTVSAGGVTVTSGGATITGGATFGGSAPGVRTTGAFIGSGEKATYSASITPTGQAHTLIRVTNNSAFTINAPVLGGAAAESATVTIEIYNDSGGAMGAITWAAAGFVLHSAFTNPANTFRRAITFYYSGATDGKARWVEIGRTGADF